MDDETEIATSEPEVTPLELHRGQQLSVEDRARLVLLEIAEDKSVPVQFRLTACAGLLWTNS